MPRNLCGILLLGLFLCLFCGSASAQSFSASLSGIVKDPRGAAVPRAEVTLTFRATNVSPHVTSGADGSYTIANLRPGKYELTVSATGFGEYVQTGIELTANENARQDVHPRVGAFQQVVEVRDNASPLNTTNAEVKGTIPPDESQRENDWLRTVEVSP